MRKTIKINTGIILLASLIGCASQPENIKSAYISPLQYSDYSCKQLGMEMARVTRRLSDISGVQEDEATGDAVAMGVGLVVFWPALFFLAGDDVEEEVSRLKGEYEAVEIAIIQKECENYAAIAQAKNKRIEQK